MSYAAFIAEKMTAQVPLADRDARTLCGDPSRSGADPQA
jgi:hypothetical protein